MVVSSTGSQPIVDHRAQGGYVNGNGVRNGLNLLRGVPTVRC